MKKILIFSLLVFLLSCHIEKNDVQSLTNEDYDLELVKNNTEKINFKKFKGEVIFLNFWGSWCPPCRAEMPSVQALYDQYGDSVRFVLISMEEPAEGYIQYLNKENYTLPAYQAASVVPSILKPRSFPTTYIINKKGEIALKRGTAREWNKKDVHILLDSLINQ